METTGPRPGRVARGARRGRRQRQDRHRHGAPRRRAARRPSGCWPGARRPPPQPSSAIRRRCAPHDRAPDARASGSCRAPRSTAWTRRWSGSTAPPTPTCIDFVTRPYTDDERAELRAGARRAATRRRSRGSTSAWPSGRRTRCEAVLAQARVPASELGLIAFHGQTDLARAADGHLAARRAGRAGRAVRRPGGEQLPRARRGGRRAGRPAVPMADVLLFAAPTVPGVLLNLGGMANLTYVAAPRRRRTACWPSTPAPAWRSIDGVARQVDRRRSYDRDGLIAAQGTAGRGRARRAAGRSVLRGAAAEEHRPRALRRRLRRARCTRGCPAPTASPPRSSSPRGASRRRWAAGRPPGTEVVASGGGCHHPGLMAALERRLAALPAAHRAPPVRRPLLPGRRQGGGRLRAARAILRCTGSPATSPPRPAQAAPASSARSRLA